MRIGTNHFVNFTKACDYFRGQGYGSCTPSELETIVRAKIDDGEIDLGKPDGAVGERLVLIDNGTRYALER